MVNWRAIHLLRPVSQVRSSNRSIFTSGLSRCASSQGRNPAGFISPATHHRWEKECGGADVNTVRENQALREEIARLKKLVAEQALDFSLLKELT